MPLPNLATLALALIAAPVAAQGIIPQLGPSAADVQAAKDQAAQALAVAQAGTPADCPAPQPDALVAFAGSQPRCMPRQDAVRATQVQARNVVTLADGTFSGTWGVAFPTVPSGAVATARTVSSPYNCQVAPSTDTTTFTGKCWQLMATSLPTLATSLPGTVISPFVNAAAGVPVTVYGRQ